MFTPETSSFTEVRNIWDWVQAFPRSPSQLNRIFESDAEIFMDSNLQKWAITLDSVSEEYRWGLLREPSTLGWIAVTASLSDLAAVGASPLGVLMGLACNLPTESGFQKSLWQGINAALKAHRCFLLGGDQSQGVDFVLSCTALGKITTKKQLSRVGANAGDLIYSTGPFGWGNAVAFVNFLLAKKEPIMARNLDLTYRPLARIQEGQILAELATCCLDSSDGFLAGLDLLLEINGVGAEIQWNENIFHPAALQTVKMLGLPLPLMATVNNGEFELLFTVAPENEKAILAKLQSISNIPLLLGKITAEKGLRIGESKTLLPLEEIKNLLAEGIHSEEYIQRHLQFIQTSFR